MQDYDEKYPTGIEANYGTPIGLVRAGTIYPYTKNGQILKCPCSLDTLPDGTDTNITYAYNFVIPRPAPVGAGSYSATLIAPSNTVLLMECAGFGVRAENGQDFGASYNSSSPATEGQGMYCAFTGPWFCGGGAFATGNMGGRISGTYGHLVGQFTRPGRHAEGANFLAADGHVKWLRGDKVSTGNKAAPSNSAQTVGEAAGTENSSFALTFSTQ